MRATAIFVRFSYALVLALAILFGVPLALYSADVHVSGAQAQQEAELLLFPDPVRLKPGKTALVEVRASSTVLVHEAHITLTLNTSAVQFVAPFLGNPTSLKPIDTFSGQQELSFVLQSPEGVTGQMTLAHILLSAPEDAVQDQATLLDFGGSTTLLGANLGHISLNMRPAQVRIEEPAAIAITSTTHPNEASWHAKQNANVTWEIQEGALYSYEISRLATKNPDNEPDEPTAAIELRELTDGIWYFALCELQAGDCGAISRRRYMIDATPPGDFAVRFEQEEGVWYAYFAPHDEQSGIAAVEVAHDPEGALRGDRSVWVEVASPYRLPDGYTGDLLVRATDLAGNATTVRGSMPPSGREGRTTAALLLIFSSAFAAYALWRFEHKAEKQH